MSSRHMMQNHIPAAPAIERTVVFANLPAEVNEYWIRSVIAPLGLVQSVELSQGPGGTLQAKVAFPTTDQAQAAVHFHGQIALDRPIHIQLPQDAFMKNPQHFAQPQMGRHPLALNVDLNSYHGGRPRIAGQMPLAGQRHRGVELEPTHKNLYVLNLPLDATTDQLAALFGQYGAVVHCVILAMLDAQARRRGFIDMAAAEGAKEAIEALNGFVWHGYPIEVSYAIVQRSGGPFEQAAGRHVIKRNVPRNRFNTGPRRVPSDATVSPLAAGGRHPAILGGGGGPVSAGAVSAANGIVGYNSPAMQHGQGMYDPMMGAGYPDIQGRSLEYPNMAGVFAGAGAQEHSPIPSDPCTLFISGLDPVAILDDEDLRHALEVYGPVQAVSLSRDGSNMSRGFGMVTYIHEASARKAKAGLDGKLFNGRKVSAHHLPFNRNMPDLLPLSVNNSSTCSPVGTHSGLPSGLSMMDPGSLTSSPEYRRGPSGYSMGGTPASGSGGGYGHTNFSTPQPQSSSTSNSDFPTYNLPPVPATEGPMPSSSSFIRQQQQQHQQHQQHQQQQQQQQTNFSYHLGFSPNNWSAASSKGYTDVRSPGETVNGARYAMQGGGDSSAVLAEPFVHRSNSGNVLGPSASPVTEQHTGGAQDSSKGYPLGAPFESPSVHGLSPSTLKSNNAAFSTGGVFASSGSRGPLDASSFEFYPSDKGEAGQQGGQQSGSGNLRPLSRSSGSLGVTLGSDVAASIAAAAGAPPMFFPKTTTTTSNRSGQSTSAEAVSAEQNRNGGGMADTTPKLDGQPFSASVHSTPLTRRGNGHGHAHMYSHITRSAGPGTSIGSMGSISHAGSTSALSAASWARTPQSSLSSLEQISPASGSSALGNGTPGGLVFKQAESHEEPLSGGSAFTLTGNGGGERSMKGSMHSASASASHPWAGFPGGSAMAPWTSPQAVAGSYSSSKENRNHGAQGPSSDSSSFTETNGGHSALRSLHQGSPPYSAALDSGYRKVPLAPVGHEKSASITSPRTRLSSGSTGAVGGATNENGNNPRRHGAGYNNENASIDLSKAVAGLNIST